MKNYTKLTVTLPWPAKELFPNKKMHWGAKARKVKRARKNAKDLTPLTHNLDGQLEVVAHFFPPHWGFDKDNCIAACKAYQDGICDKIGINDNKIKESHYYMHKYVKTNARVEITITSISLEKSDGA